MDAARRRFLAALLPALSAAPVAAGAMSGQDDEPAPGFANPHLLVDTAWLAEHGSGAGVRVVDARERDDYEAGHLPGAVSVPRSATFAREGPRSMVGTPEEIGALFGAVGVDPSVHVVVYDEGRSTAAARVFWTLEYHGCPRVSVLDGGIAKWIAEGREVTRGVPAVAAVEFAPEPRPELLSTREEVLVDLDADDVVMLDARSLGEYTGALPRGRGGHLPGAAHIEWTQNFTTGDVPVFRPAEELAELYRSAGMAGDKRAHCY